MSLGQKLSTDILVTTIFDFATRLRGIVFIPVITGILSVAAYGAYAQLLAITSLLAIVFELGLHGSLVRYAQDDGDTAELYYSLTSFAVVVGVGVAAILYTVASPLSRLVLSGTEYAVVFRIGAVLVPLRIWGNMAGNYFRSEMQVKFFSGLRTARAYLSIVGVLVVLLLFNYGLPGVISVIVGVELLYVLFLQGIIIHRIGITIPEYNNFSKHIQYSLPLAASILAGNISSRADRLLIGYFMGPTAVGIYTIVYQISTSLSLFVQPITTTFFPEFSKLIESGEIEECMKYHTNGVRYYLGLCLPGVGGLYLIGPDVIQIISTTATANASITLLPVVGLGIFMFGLDQIYGVLLTSSERTTILAVIRGSSAGVNIVLNALLIPEFGIMGAAVATAATYGMSFAALYAKVDSIYDIHFDLPFLLKITVASVVMVASFEYVAIDNLIVILLAAPIYYLILLLLLRVEELEKILAKSVSQM